MIYAIYLILAVLVVWLSIKSAKYVDLIDKKTEISGAFIGGVILAAVTSLPELFTSISSVLVLDEPGLVLGNILGSNIFNLAIIACLMIFFVKAFTTSTISKSHFITMIFVAGVYAVMLVTIVLHQSFNVFSVAITSIIIAISYLVSIKFMASDNSSAPQEEEEVISDSVKKIVFKFVLSAIGLIFTSIAITIATDKLADALNLGTTLAGALFLGIATSLPEVASCIALVKRKNFNAAVGNIVGSNMFNFFILFLADLMYSKGSIYDITNSVAVKQTDNLVVFGLISSISIATVLLLKNKKVHSKVAYILLSVVSVACYFAFLVF